MAVKYVFVTGGVVSGLGKGITAASLGRLLKARGYQVTMQKFDPYINVDPGTMNPIQHGEVFVTDDGTETDLDLGHYERFIDESLDKNSNVTTGKIYTNLNSYLIKILMLQPVKFTGPFFKKNDMGITAEGQFRLSLILQMKLKAVSTVQNFLMKSESLLSKLAVR